MSNIHAAEQRKYLESLLPNAKACIMKSDSLAHQKHQEYLSPNTKAHILESNSAALQKHQQSLSSSMKACIQESNDINAKALEDLYKTTIN